MSAINWISGHVTHKQKFIISACSKSRGQVSKIIPTSWFYYMHYSDCAFPRKSYPAQPCCQFNQCSNLNRRNDNYVVFSHPLSQAVIVPLQMPLRICVCPAISVGGRVLNYLPSIYLRGFSDVDSIAVQFPNYLVRSKWLPSPSRAAPVDLAKHLVFTSISPAGEIVFIH